MLPEQLGLLSLGIEEESRGAVPKASQTPIIPLWEPGLPPAFISKRQQTAPGFPSAPGEPNVPVL